MQAVFISHFYQHLAVFKGFSISTLQLVNSHIFFVENPFDCTLDEK